jgi:hypothetical protein
VLLRPLPGTEVLCYSGRRLLPKFFVTQAAACDRSSVSVTQAAAWDQRSVSVTQAAACDRSAALALEKKKLSLRKLVLLPPHFQIIPKSCDLLLIFPCLFPTFLGRMFSSDYGDGLYGSSLSEVPFQGSTFRLTSARLLGDSISARRTKQNRISY